MPMWECQSQSLKETHGTLKRVIKNNWMKGQFTKGRAEPRTPTRASKAPGASHRGALNTHGPNEEDEGLVPGTWPVGRLSERVSTGAVAFSRELQPLAICGLAGKELEEYIPKPVPSYPLSVPPIGQTHQNPERRELG